MPCLRGIELSIVAAPDHGVFPEFPHPDASVRVDNRKAADHRRGSAAFPEPLLRDTGGGGLSDGALGVAAPRVSVYIPSAPNTSFSIRYRVRTPPAAHRFLVFRLAVNGRDTVTWGLDLADATNGAVHQALFEPAAHDPHLADGMRSAPHAIESRSFRFVSCSGGDRGAASVAADGGLVDVQVFRARARIRRPPQPTPYRAAGSYGIALVRNGLVENPHAATYYDYHLVDARDAPYATFRFHYRSWDNLRALQLAPAEKPVFLGSPTPPPPPKSAARRLRASVGTWSVSAHAANSQDASHASDSLAEIEPVSGRPCVSGSATSDRRRRATCRPPHVLSPDLEVPSATPTPGVVGQHGRDTSPDSPATRASRARPLPALPAHHKDAAPGSAVRLKRPGHVERVRRLEARFYEPLGDDVFGGPRACVSPSDGPLRPESPQRRPPHYYELRFVAPFTDSLCKRPALLPAPPVLQSGSNPKSLRGASDNMTARGRGSPVPRRHRPSLDSGMDSLLGNVRLGGPGGFFEGVAGPKDG